MWARLVSIKVVVVGFALCFAMPSANGAFAGRGALAFPQQTCLGPETRQIAGRDDCQLPSSALYAGQDQKAANQTPRKQQHHSSEAGKILILGGAEAFAM